ncbi:DUF3871 family protein [Fodinibius sediminis]|uniref:Uncharacterized protein n=1 Tax=Fodinibius sediminis TaxID=1214077 RepID=A0A521DLI6_9BACT|nr:DUF3871 family protein [Fodinibius sediminis]SMO72442.1 protein of unknown function [Fodinibius sediminis]
MESNQLNFNTTTNWKEETVKDEKLHFQAPETKRLKHYELDLLHIVPENKEENKPFISHTTFVDSVIGIVEHVFPLQCNLEPNILVKQPVIGRIPQAKGKPDSQLQEFEKTIYYNAMRVVIPVPITSELEAFNLTYIIGGFHCYNQSSDCKKPGEEIIKIFEGFEDKRSRQLAIKTCETLIANQLESVRALEGRLFNFVKRVSNYPGFSANTEM